MGDEAGTKSTIYDALTVVALGGGRDRNTGRLCGTVELCSLRLTQGVKLVHCLSTNTTSGLQMHVLLPVPVACSHQTTVLHRNQPGYIVSSETRLPQESRDQEGTRAGEPSA